MALSKGAKIGIGLGVATVLGAAVFMFLKKPKSPYEGKIIEIAGSGRTYVVVDGFKRSLTSWDVARSYGLNPDNRVVVDESVEAALPTGEVFQ